MAHFKLKDGYIMSTIELYKDKINSMSNYIEQAKTAVSDYCTDLSALKSKILGINSSVCDSIVSKISSSSQTQEQQIVGLEATQREVNDFIDLTIKRDNSLLQLLRKPRTNFTRSMNTLIQTVKSRTGRNSAILLKMSANGAKNTGNLL